MNPRWKSENKMSVSELWVAFFRHFCIVHQFKRNLINIRYTDINALNESKINGNRFPLEGQNFICVPYGYSTSCSSYGAVIIVGSASTDSGGAVEW